MCQLKSKYFWLCHWLECLPVPPSIADNLPVATRLEIYPIREAGLEEEQQKREAVKDIQFEHGYRMGFYDGNKVSFPLRSSSVTLLCSF